ncbi:MAG: hypothetical protein FD123_4347, partial [Bacteroidetes bacterium]
MHKKILFSRLAVPVLLSLFFSGCSWLNQVYIFNRSKHDVVVHYAVGGNSFPGKAYAFKIDSWSAKNITLGDSIKVYSRKEEGGVFYFELPPQTALLIGEMMNKDLLNESDCR